MKVEDDTMLIRRFKQRIQRFVQGYVVDYSETGNTVDRYGTQPTPSLSGTGFAAGSA